MRIFFILLPLLELILLIKVGSIIGALNTVALLIATGFIGIAVVRQQGFRTLNQIRMQIVKGELPATEMLDGILVAIAGGMILLPGFITDSIGLLLLLPPFRKIILNKAVLIEQRKTDQPNIYEGEWTQETQDISEATQVHDTIDKPLQHSTSEEKMKKN